VNTAFNLINEPWIPARALDGSQDLYSLRDTLVRAHELQGIEDPSPLVVASLHRLLLAVLHRALEGPEDSIAAAEWLMDGAFPAEDIDGYLDAWKGRFELFSENMRFLQVEPHDDFLDPKLHAPCTTLAAEVAGRNNATLFDHSGDENPRPISAAEAARLLVADQSFALGGGKSSLGLSNRRDGPLASALAVVPVGETLFETFCLNLLPYPPANREQDAPAWERPPLTLDALRASPMRVPLGLTDRYTWQTRCVRLQPNDDLTVTQTIHASGAGLDKAEVAEIDIDPMSPFRAGDKGPVAIRLRGGQALWRDFLALIPGHSSWTPARTVEHAAYVRQETGDDAVLPVQVLGQGRVPAQAKLERWRSETFYLPSAVLRERPAVQVVEACLEAAEETGQSLRAVSRALAGKLLSTGDRKPHRDDIACISQTIPLVTSYWSSLESHFPALLNRFRPGWDADASQVFWDNALLDTANDAWRTAVASVGVDARTLRAIQHAENELHRRLSPLRERAE